MSDVEFGHLPPALRDFHDMKDAFKAMSPDIEAHNQMNADTSLMRDTNWMELQCWTVDLVLKFFARHGYTLQRTPKALREKRGCLELSETIAAMKEKQGAQLERILRR